MWSVVPSGNFCRGAAIASVFCPIGAVVPLGSHGARSLLVSHVKRGASHPISLPCAACWEGRTPSWAVSESMPHSSGPRQSSSSLWFHIASPDPRDPPESKSDPPPMVAREGRSASGAGRGAMGSERRTLWQRASHTWRASVYPPQNSQTRRHGRPSTANFRPARRVVAGVR